LYLEAAVELLGQALHNTEAQAFRRRDIKIGRQSVTVIGDL